MQKTRENDEHKEFQFRRISSEVNKKSLNFRLKRGENVKRHMEIVIDVLSQGGWK